VNEADIKEEIYLPKLSRPLEAVYSTEWLSYSILNFEISLGVSSFESFGDLNVHLLENILHNKTNFSLVGRFAFT